MKRRWQYVGLILGVWLVYLGFSLATPQPASSTRYHLSNTTVNLIRVTFELPFLFCWLYAVSGWLHFRDYIKGRPHDHEHQAFAKIAQGLLTLIIGLIVPTVISTIYLYYNNGASQGPLWVRINNYINIFFPLLGFLWMLKGSQQLMNTLKLKVTSWSKIITVLIPVSLFAVFYLALIFTNPTRQSSPDATLPATYYLPDVLIILTIIIPVICTWVMGLLLALNLEQFSHHTVRSHQLALVSFYNGVLAIVGGAILSQALSSLGSHRFSKLNVGLILSLVYLLLLIITVGYGLIARGAKKLAQADTHIATG